MGRFSILNPRSSILTALALVALLPATVRADEPTRLTSDGDFKQHLQWSPDGKKFLFTRIHQRKMGLWTMNADGTDVSPAHQAR